MTAAQYFVFILSCIALLYFVFEEEIRNLIGANAKKDIILAEQAEKIQKMEPLSVLGERTAHVVHSLKNTMQQVTTAEFLLEHKRDIDGALERLKLYSISMEERLTNVLMVSRAGQVQEIEQFDLKRLLDGINFIYLQEESFLQVAKTDVRLPDYPVMVQTVRWQVILMMENLIKNALDAISTAGRRGSVRIVLTGKELIVANDGGAMPQCGQCLETSCLSCAKYGHLGQTYGKREGTGHGLAQVFSAIREAGWDLKISTESDWTRFHIKLN